MMMQRFETPVFSRLTLLNGAEVVVYRFKFNETTRTWNPVNMTDPIRVADVVQYGNNKRYTTKMNRILSMR